VKDDTEGRTGSGPPPTAGKPSRKIGTKTIAVADAGVGTVKEIRMGSEYGEAVPGAATVAIEHGKRPKPKTPKKGESQGLVSYSEPKISRVCVTEADAKKLTIGQRVRVRVEPA
jgi:hypothetical protein